MVENNLVKKFEINEWGCLSEVRKFPQTLNSRHLKITARVDDMAGVGALFGLLYYKKKFL